MEYFETFGDDAEDLVRDINYLPGSLRDRYFDLMEPLGFDAGTPLLELPDEYRDDRWWRHLEGH